jgi:hypothetical protein
LADDFDDVLTAVDLLESVISTSAQHKEIIAKHIQSILLTKHLQPVSGMYKSLFIYTVL